MKWGKMLSFKSPSTFGIWSFDKKKPPAPLRRTSVPRSLCPILASDLVSQKRTQAKNKHHTLSFWLRWLLAQERKTTCPNSDQMSISASTLCPARARNACLWGSTNIRTNMVWHFPAIFFQFLTVCGSGASFVVNNPQMYFSYINLSNVLFKLFKLLSPTIS